MPILNTLHYGAEHWKKLDLFWKFCRKKQALIYGMPINCSCTTNGRLLNKGLGEPPMRFG